MLTWLSGILFGILGIQDAYQTSTIYDKRRQKALDKGEQYFYGRRGEMYDVVTGKQCRIKHDNKGNRYLVSAKNGKFIRHLTLEERLTEREKARRENRLAYMHDTKGLGAKYVLREVATDRIFEHRYNKDFIEYKKIVNGNIVFDTVGFIPKSAMNYYDYPFRPVPEDIMKEGIAYEEQRGIYREPREKSKN